MSCFRIIESFSTTYSGRTHSGNAFACAGPLTTVCEPSWLCLFIDVDSVSCLFLLSGTAVFFAARCVLRHVRKGNYQYRFLRFWLNQEVDKETSDTGDEDASRSWISLMVLFVSDVLCRYEVAYPLSMHHLVCLIGLLPWGTLDVTDVKSRCHKIVQFQEGVECDRKNDQTQLQPCQQPHPHQENASRHTESLLGIYHVRSLLAGTFLCQITAFLTMVILYRKKAGMGRFAYPKVWASVGWFMILIRHFMWSWQFRGMYNLPHVSLYAKLMDTACPTFMLYYDWMMARTFQRMWQGLI